MNGIKGVILSMFCTISLTCAAENLQAMKASIRNSDYRKFTFLLESEGISRQDIAEVHDYARQVTKQLSTIKMSLRDKIELAIGSLLTAGFGCVALAQLISAWVKLKKNEQAQKVSAGSKMLSLRDLGIAAVGTSLGVWAIKRGWGCHSARTRLESAKKIENSLKGLAVTELTRRIFEKPEQNTNELLAELKLDEKN